MGVVVGHTIGNRGAWVIAPSLRVGANAWAFFGGAYSDSQGSTRTGLVGGISFRVSDILGPVAGGGQQQEQAAAGDIPVHAVSDPRARLGPGGRITTDALVNVKIEDPALRMDLGETGSDTGYWLKVVESVTEHTAVLPLKKPGDAMPFTVHTGIVKEVQLWKGSPKRTGSTMIGSTSTFDAATYLVTADPPLGMADLELKLRDILTVVISKKP
jgi:hypothetical protein